MAQLRDTVVSGSLRATDTLFSTTAQFQILRVPTSSNGTTFGPGSNNNLLKSNGTSVYWTTLAASDIPTISITDKTSGTLTVARGGTGQTSIANIQAGKDGDGNTISSTYLKLSGGTMTGALTAVGSLTTYSTDQQTRTILSNNMLNFQFYNSSAQPKGWRDALRLTADSQSATIGTFAGISELNISGRGRVKLKNQASTTDTDYAEIDMNNDSVLLTATKNDSGSVVWTSLQIAKDGIIVSKQDTIGDSYVLFKLTSGQSSNPLSIGNGGTGATTAANARTNLSVPSTTGSGASGTWGINVTGSSGSCTGHAASDLALTGGTLSGHLYSTAFWANQGTGERQMGVSYNGGNLYFYGNPSSGAAGIYDNIGGYVIERDATYSRYNSYFSRTEISNHLMCSTKTAGIAFNENGSAIQIREVGLVQNAQSAWTYAPKLGFHWSGRVAAQLGLDSSGWLQLYNNNSTDHAPMALSRIIVDAANGMRFVGGSGTTKSILARIDGSNFWLLCCNSAGDGDNWYVPTEGGHPFYMGLDSGKIYIHSLELGKALPITSGGTGATTAAGARANLGLNDIGDKISQERIILSNDGQTHTINVTSDCWVCASFHVVANTNGGVIMLRDSNPIILNGNSDGACNYWANAQFPCKAGGSLKYMLNSNATDSRIYFLTV